MRSAMRVLMISLGLVVLLSCARRPRAGGDAVIGDRAVSATVAPSSQTIVEGDFASWTGDVVFVESTDGAPTYLGWDFDGDGTDDAILCSGASACAQYCAGPFFGSSAADYPTGDDPYGLSISDLDHNGTGDVINGDVGMAAFSVLLADSNGLLASHVDVPAPQGIVHGIAPGDFNGDGNTDVVAVTQQPIEIHFGAGDGSFSSMTTAVAGSGSCIERAAAGDLDGDTLPDIAVTNECSRTVTVLLSSTSGSFASAGDTITGRQPMDVALADFNRDGRLDVVTADSGETNDVSVLLGLGAGVLNSNMEFATGGITDTLAVGDLNGDGNPDIVTGNGTSISVLLGNGDGTFAPHADYSAGGSDVASVSIADIDGDGREDVAYVLTAASEIIVRAGDGAGGLGPLISFPTTYKAWKLALGDVNGDGRLDLAATTSNFHQGYISLRLGTKGVWRCPIGQAHQFTDSKGSGVGPAVTFHSKLNVAGTLSGTTQFTSDVTVQNVAPANNGFAAPTVATAEGSYYGATFAACDPGTNDEVTAHIAWGDGTTATHVMPSACSSASLLHLYPNGGSYQASVSFSDDEGATSGSASQTVDVLDSVPTITSLATSSPVPVGANATIYIALQPAIGDVVHYDFAWHGDSSFSDPEDILGLTVGSSSLASATARSLDVPVRVRDDDGNVTVATAHVEWVGPPLAPGLLAPPVGGVVATTTPTLVVTTAAGASAYEFELDSSPLFQSPLQLSATPDVNGGSVSWTPPIPLEENTTYFWRARAEGSFAPSDWMTSSFTVNAVNSPPSSPVALSPTGGGEVDPAGLVLDALDAVDPDPDSTLSYTFIVTADSAGSAVLATSATLAEEPAHVHWQVVPALRGGRRYYWHVVATDELGASAASSPASFRTIGGGSHGGCDVASMPGRGGGAGLLLVLPLIALADPRRWRRA